jgi:hypothetical protein
MFEQIRSLLWSQKDLLRHAANREPSINKFTPIDEQVSTSQEVRIIFKSSLIGNRVSVVAPIYSSWITGNPEVIPLPWLSRATGHVLYQDFTCPLSAS